MSAPILVSALGTILAIDAANSTEQFRTSIEAAWTHSRVLAGEPRATVVANMLSDEATAHRVIQAELTHLAMENVRAGIWVLRAAAVADPSGAVTLLIASDGDDLGAVIEGSTAGATLVSAPLVGIDATGAVLPLLGPSHATTADMGSRAQVGGPNIAVTPRVSEIVVVETGSAVSIDDQAIDPLRVAELLVTSSCNLPLVPTPLRRIAGLIENCGLGRVDGRHPQSKTVFNSSTRRRPSSSWLQPTSLQARHVRTPTSSRPEPRRYFRGAVLASGNLLDGRCVVLVNDDAGVKLVILSEVEAELWQSADGVERSVLRGLGQGLEDMIAAGLIGSERAWRIDDGVAWVSSDSRTTVLGSASIGAPVLALEGSAHVIWTVLVEERTFTLGGLIQACTEVFDVGIHELSAAIGALLTDLEARGVVVPI